MEDENLTTGRALSEMVVLDLSQVMAGPYCTMVLADLGADVIKVENPDAGDQTRRSWGKPGAGEDSRAFMALNRNKRSVTLDLKAEADRQRFYKLVRNADVVVEGFRPGVAARLGVDYKELKRINPSIIYASISGFGQNGPYADRPGYDLIAQAMAGAMSVTGEEERPPVKSGLPVGDLGAGLFTAIGILGAWTWLKKTGEGQYVETSLFESVLALSVWESVEYWTSGKTPKPMGSAHRMSAPYQALRTKSGYITIGANNQRLWQQLCRALGDPQLASDPRFASNADRMTNLPELVELLERKLSTRDTDSWTEVLLEHGVPAGPIQDYHTILENDPQVRARGMIDHFVHPIDGEVPVVASPIKLSRTPATIYRHPPLLGQHTEEVLKTLGGG